MSKGSKNSGYSAPKTVASVSYVSHVPVKTTVTVKGAKGCGGGEASYQTRSRMSYGDKQSGSYGRVTSMEKASRGEFCWKNGTSGVKIEYKNSSTVRVGDQRGSVKMSKGTKNSGSSAPKTVATVHYVSHVPVKTTVTIKGAKGCGGGEASYQTKSRMSYGHKQIGSYGRATTMDKASSGEFCRKNGTSGVKNEYKKSSTVRVGDQRGYTEVYHEERVRNVTFDKSRAAVGARPW